MTPPRAAFTAVVTGGLFDLRLMRESCAAVRSQLLAAMSHDFRCRSPRSAARAVLRDEPRPRAERGAPRTLLANVQRLEDLVENVLVAARLHAGRPRRAANRSTSPPRSSAAQQRAAPSRSAVPTSKRRRAACACSSTRALQSILGNLVDNALKFADGTPRIALSLARETGPGGAARAVLRVRDQGVGFPPEDAPLLFDRFHRGSAEQDVSRPGLGLGLFLVREFARLHGGDATATSGGPGRGSEFVVTLPLADTAEAPAAAPIGATA
jgi:signal transduction histidine kinase